MKWLEFIKLRTGGAGKENINLELPNRISTHLNTPGLLKATLYTHAVFPGDICIALDWETNNPKSGGSELGLGLVQEFRRAGLIDHSVWIDIGTLPKVQARKKETFF